MKAEKLKWLATASDKTSRTLNWGSLGWSIQSQAVATNRLAVSSVTQVPDNTSHSMGDCDIFLKPEGLKKEKSHCLEVLTEKKMDEFITDTVNFFFPDHDDT